MNRKSFIPTISLVLVFLAFLPAIQICIYAQLPDLLPKKVFFMGQTKTQAKISPNGQYIAYLAPSAQNVFNVWIKKLDKEDDRMVTTEEKRGIHEFDWAFDSKHIIYLEPIRKGSVNGITQKPQNHRTAVYKRFKIYHFQGTRFFRPFRIGSI
jgi:tricorn protease-like protein